MGVDIEALRALKIPNGIFMVTRTRNGETWTEPTKESIDAYAAMQEAMPLLIAENARLAAEHAKDTPPWFQFNADEIEALVHTIDDVTRMSSLDDDGGPKAEVVRKTAIATLRRLLGIEVSDAD